MSPRRVSREPYHAKRPRREVALATGVALVIVVLTAVTVWILAPADEARDPVVNPFGPSVTLPDETATSTPAETPATTSAGG
jgi:hypothetical protein